MALFDPITVNDVGQEVLKNINDFDKNIKGMSNLLSFGLADDRYSGLYGLAQNISLAIGGVCLAMAVIYTYLAIVKEGLSLRGDWKKVVTILLKLAISKGLIDCATQFVTWIYSFFAKISQIVVQVTTNKTPGTALGSMLDINDIANGLNITDKSSGFSMFMALQYARMFGLVFFILSIIVLIIGLARVLKIYVLLAFSAVAFSKIPLYGIDGCKEYIREMCALGLQGGIIMAIICMFEVATTQISDILSVSSTWGSLGGILVLSISMMLLIFKSEELARKVI